MLSQGTDRAAADSRSFNGLHAHDSVPMVREHGSSRDICILPR
jgi:hypothetical protein